MFSAGAAASDDGGEGFTSNLMRFAVQVGLGAGAEQRRGPRRARGLRTSHSSANTAKMSREIDHRFLSAKVTRKERALSMGPSRQLFATFCGGRGSVDSRPSVASVTPGPVTTSFVFVCLLVWLL
jgi:hypothetical protein